MRLAFIPPTAHLGRFLPLTNMQLVLPQQLRDDEQYKRAYLGLLRTGADFTIMDNGAAESATIDDQELYDLITKYHPTEFVLPDVLRNSEETIIRSCYFYDRFWKAPFTSLGVVAQGTDYETAKQTIDTFAGSGIPIRTFYIPRLLVSEDDYTVRIKLATYINKTYGTLFSIHLLGASSLWPRELDKAREMAPYIRSMDTSMPFVYARAGLRVSETTGHPHRDGGSYFGEKLSSDQERLALANCNIMMGWAGLQ